MASHLNSNQKRKIQTLYLSGTKPLEIAKQMGLKAGSVRQHVHRHKLTQRRDEIDTARQRTAREVLESVRQKSVADFEAVLELLNEGVKIDAGKLCDGWGMVQDAAGASSLMRAKSQLFDRTLRAFGVDKADPGPDIAAIGLNFFVLSPSAVVKRVDPVDAAKQIETTPCDKINP
jgi:hypothetical protein